MMKLSENIDEIVRDPALRIYGAILAALNTLSFLHWTLNLPLRRILRADGLHVCWPFLQDCEWMRWLNDPGLANALWVWLALSLVAAALFAKPSTTKWGWALLVVALILKQWMIFGDYRLRTNQHYMALWATAGFLLIPGRRRVLPYLIIFFYVWAALLKFSPEWLSGNWTYGHTPLGMPESWMPAASVYVLVLELVVIWGLLSRRAWLFWLTFAQLVLFHVASWNVVGFFYPMLMFGILSIFPLMRLIPPPDAEADPVRRPLGLRSLLSGAEPRAVVVTLALFSALQVAPLMYPGDTAVTGEGRWISLHMFDAPVHCVAKMRLHRAGGQIDEQVISQNMLVLTERIRCDPLVYFSFVRQICRMDKDKRKFEDVDLTVDSARKGKPTRNVVSIEKFCTTGPRYDWWRHNEWINSGA